MSDALIRLAVVAQAVWAGLMFLYLMDTGTFEQLDLVVGEEPGLDETNLKFVQSNGSETRSSSTRLNKHPRKRENKDPDVAVVDWLIAMEMARRGVDDTAVKRRVAEIVETRERTREVKRAEEERRFNEVIQGFERLMRHHPESGEKAREILYEYVDLRHRTFGVMEEIDPGFAAAQRDVVRQRLGDRLLNELPPAQGLTILKELFI